jgi:DNA-binding protein H-NS
VFALSFWSRRRRSGHHERASKANCFGPETRSSPAQEHHSMDHRNMKPHDLKSMSVDELWALHVEIGAVLTRRISAEKTQLERRLRQLQSSGASSASFQRERRPYPQVFPKYRNPANPSETWSGRGKQPRWLTGQLRSGKKLDDFRIEQSSDHARRLRSRS